MYNNIYGKYGENVLEMLHGYVVCSFSKGVVVALSLKTIHCG